MKFRPAIAAVSVTLLAGCASSSAGENDEFTLSAADWYPTTHMAIEDGTQVWMERVGELTDGNVQFDHYPAEQLGKGSDFLKLMQTGAADSALIGSPYYPSEMQLSTVGQLPGLFETSCEGAEKYWPLVKPGSEIAETEMKEMGVVPVYTGVSPSFDILTSDTRVETPEDVQGLKLRTSGGIFESAVSAVGGAPVSITANEQYEALNRGTVDGLAWGYASAPDYSLEEVLNYGTVGARLGSFPTIQTISLDVWEEMPTEYQDAILQAGEETTAHLCKVWDETDKETQDEWVNDGFELVELTDEQRQEWTDAVSSVQQEWLDGVPEDKKSWAEDALESLQTE